MIAMCFVTAARFDSFLGFESIVSSPRLLHLMLELCPGENVQGFLPLNRMAIYGI